MVSLVEKWHSGFSPLTIRSAPNSLTRAMLRIATTPNPSSKEEGLVAVPLAMP